MSAAFGNVMDTLSTNETDAGSAPSSVEVTLITGQTVTAVGPPENRSYRVDADVPMRIERTPHATYVYPVGTDFETFDRALFDVELLIRQGLTDAEGDAIPVIVESESNESAARVSATASVSGLGNTRSLSSIDAAAGEVPRESAGTVAARLSRSPTIERVHLDIAYRIALDGASSATGAPTARQRFDVNGTGVTVAVLDTGIDATHPDLAGRIAAERDFTDEGTTTDLNGHGTHVAGIVAGDGTASNGTYTGIAPNATVLNVRVLDSSGTGYTSWIINGIEYATDRDADVISISLGGPAGTNRSNDPFADAIEQATAEGTTVVVAAGNSGRDGYGTVNTPGIVDDAITVGATDGHGTVEPYSSRGPTPDGFLKPDLVAPGTDITSTASGDAVASDYVDETGTSMAAPMVSGVVALLREAHPSWSPRRVRDVLGTTADPLPTADAYEQGTGRVNATAALGANLSISPSTIDFGTRDGSTNVSRTVTITNLDDRNRTVTPDVVAGAVGTNETGSVSLNRSTVDLAPGETAALRLTVSTDSPPELYAGRLSAGNGTAVFGYRLTNARPVARLAANATVVNASEPIAFDASNSTDDRGIESYAWAFGDGTTDTGSRTEHAFSALGNYTVELTVTDSSGATDAASVPVRVVDRTPPSAALTANRSAVDIGNASVRLDASNSTDDHAIADYEWDFDGDGTVDRTTAVSAVTHTYADPGTYDATVTVGDAAGNTESAATSVEVTDTTAPAASFTVNHTRANVSRPVAFDASMATDDHGIASYRWDFGDGTGATTATVTHVFDAPGAYPVSLTVADASGNAASTNVTITVVDEIPPVAALRIDPAAAEINETRVTLDATAAADNHRIARYEWDFDGDGDTDLTTTESTTTHRYASFGTVSPAVRVVDANGNVDRAVAGSVTVRDTTPPTVVASVTPKPADPGEPMQFDAGPSADNHRIERYEWDFDGDGVTDATGPTASHAFPTTGRHRVELTVTDANGTAAVEQVIAKVGNAAPVAVAIADGAVTSGTSVTLDGTGSSDPDGDELAYDWRHVAGPAVSISDTDSATARFVAPAVDSPTNVTFELAVTDGYGGSATDRVSVRIEPNVTDGGGQSGDQSGGQLQSAGQAGASARAQTTDSPTTGTGTRTAATTTERGGTGTTPPESTRQTADETTTERVHPTTSTPVPSENHSESADGRTAVSDGQSGFGIATGLVAIAVFVRRLVASAE